MRKKLFVKLSAVALTAFAVGCGDATNTNTANMNANMNADANMMTNTGAMSGDTMQTRTAPDESEITTVNEGGETREVRRFRNPNSSVERVEVVTRDGRRTAKVYYRDETVRDLPENRVEEALSATGNALADAGGYVVDKTRQGLSATGDVAGEVGDATGRVIGTAADRTKDVGSKAVEVGREGGNLAVDGAKEVGKGAKKVGEGAAKGAKKTGSAIKDAVTP